MIDSLLNTAISGLRVAGQRANVAANNIVNVNTPDFNADTVQQKTIVTSSQPSGGSRVEAQIIASEQSPDLASEIVNLIEAEIAYKANAETLRVAEDLAEELIDIQT